jgi:hypothetical protein
MRPGREGPEVPLDAEMLCYRELRLEEIDTFCSSAVSCSKVPLRAIIERLSVLRGFEVG